MAVKKQNALYLVFALGLLLFEAHHSLGNDHSTVTPPEADASANDKIESDARQEIQNEQPSAAPSQGAVENRAQQIREALPEVTESSAAQSVAGTSMGVASAAQSMMLDPMRVENRQNFLNSTAAAFKANEDFKEALASGDYNNEDYLPFLLTAAQMAASAKAPNFNNTKKKRSIATVKPPPPIQVPGVATPVRDKVRDRIDDHKEYVRQILFNENGEEIPVLVDNTEVLSGEVAQSVPAVEDKFAAIAAGPTNVSVTISNNSAASATASSVDVPNAETKTISEETAEVSNIGVSPAVASASGPSASSSEEPKFSAEDVFNALMGAESEALEKNEDGIDVGYGEGTDGEGAELADGALGKEIPLVLRPGKLRALQRGLSGKIDKPVKIGTRTGNGRRGLDGDLLFTAGEKFPVLRGLFEKARTSPTTAQLVFWLAIAVGLYFIMRLAYSLTTSPQPSYGSAPYYVARDNQHDHVPDELEISFTEPLPMHATPAMARRFGSTLVQVDPDLGQLQEDGDIPSGAFDVMENTAHSVTAMRTITQEVTGTLAPWNAEAGIELEANKIYLKMDPKSGKWYLVRTDLKARIGETLAEIFPGTVVEGKLLGPQFTAKRYRLKHNSKWAPTADKVQFVVSVMPKGNGPDWWA